MRRRWYIREYDIERKYAFYGPFKRREIDERLQDVYAELLANTLSEVDAVKLSRKEAKQIYINPRAVWMLQLAVLEEEMNA